MKRFIYTEKSTIIAEKHQIVYVKIILTLFKYEIYYQAASVHSGAPQK